MRKYKSNFCIFYEKIRQNFVRFFSRMRQLCCIWYRMLRQLATVGVIQMNCQRFARSSSREEDRQKYICICHRYLQINWNISPKVYSQLSTICTIRSRGEERPPGIYRLPDYLRKVPLLSIKPQKCQFLKGFGKKFVCVCFRLKLSHFLLVTKFFCWQKCKKIKSFGGSTARPSNPHADLFLRLASRLPCKLPVASAKWKYQVNIKHFSLAFPHCIQIQFEFLYSYSFQDSSYFNHLKTERNGLKWFSICVVFISVFFNICSFVLFKAFFVLILR